jgi:hypothetical protein
MLITLLGEVYALHDPSINCMQNSPNRLGVRSSIWQVVVVVTGAGIGALISGHSYGDLTTFGAIVGLLLGSAPAAVRRYRKDLHACTNEKKA